NHSRRFRKQVTKGAKGLVLFFPGMVKLLPALSNENRLFLQGLFPSKRRHPSHETGQLPQFQLEGHFSQFLLFKFVNDVPTLFPRHHLSLGCLAAHGTLLSPSGTRISFTILHENPPSPH